MLRADVVQAHIPPKTVQDVLGDDSASGLSSGYSVTYGWTLQRQTLLLWKVEDSLTAAARRLHLSDPPCGRLFVEVIPHSHSTAVTVVLCTGGGQLHVWLDANYPVETYKQTLAVSANSSTSPDTIICGLSATPADVGSSLGFMAVVATADAALHLYHGSQHGIFPRQFYSAAAATVPRSGMLGAFGSVVKALYSEAFDPLHNVQRSSASAMAALQLQLLQLDSNRWKLIVLTPDALDCWLLGTVSGQNSTEQLLWSFNLHGVLTGNLQARELSLLACAVTTSSNSQYMQKLTPMQQLTAGGQQQKAHSGPLLYVWSAFLSATSLVHTHVLSCFAVEEGDAVPSHLLSTHIAQTEPLPDPEVGARQLKQWQMVPHTVYSSILLLSPNGTVVEWLAGSGADASPVKALGASSGNLAITCTSSSTTVPGNWQLLNAAYGVLEFLAHDPTAHEAADALTGTLSLESEASALELLSKTVELMYKEYQAGCPYTELADGLSDRLARLGMFSGDRGTEVLVLASSTLVDRMPKAGSGQLSSGSLKDLLDTKSTKHDLLLAAYKTGGVLQQLPQHKARAVFEHAEMLATAEAVLDWQRRTEADANAGDAVTGVTSTQTAAAAAAVKAAGAAASEGSDTAGASGQQWEVFFGRPAVSMLALFSAVADAAATIMRNFPADDRAGSALHALQQLLGLCGLLQAAVSGADGKAAELSASMPEEARSQGAAGPSWRSAEPCRAAWLHLAQACLLLYPRLTDASQRLQLAHDVHLPAVQHLLSAMRDVITRSSRLPAGIREEYARLAAEHGASLLQDAAEELESSRDSDWLTKAAAALAAGPTADESSQETLAAIGRALIWPLEALAQRHKAHELLYNVCELLLTAGLMDRQRLLGWMQQEVQETHGAVPADSFTYYVMERWRSSGQLTLLMQLGRQGFQQQLQQFLASYPALLWMSQVQGGMLGQAAGTLGKAAAAEQGSVGKCRRMLCLTKLAAHASGNDEHNQQLKAKATARLRQLALQEELQLGANAPLSTAQLVIAALEGQGAVASNLAEAAIASVEALALAPEQRHTDQYRQLWERSWQSVLEQTPLQDLSAARETSRSAAGHSEEFEDLLRQSALYLALVRTAAALAAVRQAQADIEPHEVLDSTCNALAQKVQQQEPGAMDCVQDIFREAASAAEPLLAPA